MKITFVSIGWEQLSISLLAALARREGHSVSLAFSSGLFNDRYNLNIPFLAKVFDDKKNVLSRVRREEPDIVAFSPVTSTYQWMLDIAKEIKNHNPNIKIIFGGVHVSAVPERVLSKNQIDCVCVGEADYSFIEVLKLYENNDYGKIIPNARYKKPNGQIIRGPQNSFTQDLDLLPIFDKTLWEEYMDLGEIYFTMASRGCPYKCSYCFNSFFSKLNEEAPKNYVRYRSVEHLIKELKFAKRRYHIKFIEFEDDVFTFNKVWLKDFLKVYKREIKIPFQCLSHPMYMDDEVSKMLADAGCVYVQIGVQSMDDEFKRKEINRVETSERVYKAMEAIKKNNIKVKVDHMFGLPNEPLIAQEKARSLYLKFPPYRMQIFWTNYFPGTELVDKAIMNGSISAKELDSLEEGLAPDFYRSSSRNSSKENTKIYKSYELVFKLISILPIRISSKLLPKTFQRIPLFLCSVISFLVDVSSGLIKNNPDHWAYAKYYLYNINKRLMGLFKIQVLGPTRIREDIDIEPLLFSPYEKTAKGNIEEEVLK